MRTDAERQPPDRTTLAFDTSPAAEAVQISIFRAMPSWRKFELVFDAIETERILGLTGLQSRHPDADNEELRRRLFGLLLGEELATKVYGPLPSTAG